MTASQAMAIVAGIGLLAVMSVIGEQDYQVAVQQQHRYCTMVSQWRVDEMRGIPEIDRRGWADYRGEYDSMCLSDGEGK